MRFLSERARWRVLVVAAALLSVTVLVTASASAAINDDFNASTTDGYWFNQYNGNGLAGAPVIWDPFLHGNVKAGQKVGLEVCLVDGWDDLSGSRCGADGPPNPAKSVAIRPRPAAPATAQIDATS